MKRKEDDVERCIVPYDLPASSEVWVRAKYIGPSANRLAAMVLIESELFPGDPTPVSVDAKDIRHGN